MSGPPADLGHLLGLINGGRAGEALALIESRLATAPDDHRLLFFKGEALLQMGQVEAAEAALARTASLMPAPGAEILYRLGVARLLLERASDAAEALLPAIERFPDRTEWLSAGQMALERNMLPLAEELLRAAVKADPAGLQPVTLLGYLYRATRRFDEAVPCYRMAAALSPDSAPVAAHFGAALRNAGQPGEAAAVLHRALALDPNSLDAVIALADIHLDKGEFAAARALVDGCDERIAFPKGKSRSVVIPVLDYSPGSPYNIRTLLDDLGGFDGEVICIFNGDQVFEDLRGHPRIDKWSYNKFNVGVGRAWNMGIEQAEGDTIHILNADLKITVPMLYRLERWLHALPDALCVGVSAHWMDYDTLRETKVMNSGGFDQPIVVDQVSGQLFSLHARRLHDAGITFDPRLSPYFGEETDLAFKARQNGLRIYAVPETEFSHSWGISVRDRPIHYFGRPVHRLRHMTRNRILLQEKWARIKQTLSDG